MHAKWYWPEGKEARRLATVWARGEKAEAAAQERLRIQTSINACRVCGQPPSPRLYRYCVQCHCNAITGDRS